MADEDAAQDVLESCTQPTQGLEKAFERVASSVSLLSELGNDFIMKAAVLETEYAKGMQKLVAAALSPAGKEKARTRQAWHVVCFALLSC